MTQTKTVLQSATIQNEIQQDDRRSDILEIQRSILQLILEDFIHLQYCTLTHGGYEYMFYTATNLVVLQLLLLD